ncbi:MAG: SusD/RagB family nutrient-binding outer membrane lipoprotein [Mangrovibacterium sp.]
MKRIYHYKLIIIITVFSSFVFSSCSDWLDINHNPNVATDESNINPGYLFNYAVTTHSSNRQSGDFYIPLLIAGQGVADGGFNDYGGWWNEATYNISTYSTGNTWVTAYANVGTNLNKAIMFAERTENQNAIAQCNIVLAQMFFELTMTFGDVPCSEALYIEEYKTPKFDPQKDVLEQSLNLLNDAIASIDPSQEGIGDYDIFYHGNMSKWLSLAKSLKLRILMCMIDKDPSKVSEIGTLVSGGGFIESASDNWIFPFYEASGTQNPNYRINLAYASAPDYYMFFAHNSVLNLMLPYNDPRLPIYFVKGVDGNYNGVETGEDVSLNEDDAYLTSAINYQGVWKATTPDVLFSYSELCFILSEVYAKGIGVTKNLSTANTYYKTGIEEACIFWGVNSNTAAEFAQSFPALTSLTETNALNAIYAQEWVDFMLRPFEGWVNSRRTLYPVLTVPSLAPYEDLMHRWIYPDRERQVNPNVPSPLPEITDKMWFEK